MLLNFLWFGLILLSVLADLCSGQPFSSSQAALSGAADDGWVGRLWAGADEGLPPQAASAAAKTNEAARTASFIFMVFYSPFILFCGASPQEKYPTGRGNKSPARRIVLVKYCAQKSPPGSGRGK